MVFLIQLLMGTIIERAFVCVCGCVCVCVGVSPWRINVDIHMGTLWGDHGKGCVSLVSFPVS
jgi:hypothetical protein